MARFDINRVAQGALAVFSIGVIATLAILWFRQTETQTLTLAAGASSGESYILSSALKTVVERHSPRVRLNIVETGGTVENLRMLENGQAQLATAQADISPGPAARSLAVLYDDAFQLLVPKDSAVKSLVDLRGRRIALAQTGGQFQSFLRVVEHFGLAQADFQFVGSNDEAAAEAFRNGQADAIFRVRAIGDPSVEQLVRSGNVRFLPIEHATAMKIRYPAFGATVIPEGAYSGSPAVPAQDVPTVAVHRTLLARDTVSQEAVRAITEALLTRRQEIMEQIPVSMAEVRLLLVQVRRPDPQTGLGSAVHPGALAFYDKDKPSFLMAHSDFVGLILTVGLMAGSWIWELRRWVQRQQKSNADKYSNRVVDLISHVQEIRSIQPLEQTWSELLQILTEAVRDLDADKLSEESFNSFRVILQIGMEATRERRSMLMSAEPARETALKA